jgi:hypothetical protein
MQIEQFYWTADQDWCPRIPGQSPLNPQLVMLFGEGQILQNASLIGPLHTAYPHAYFLGCSTAGEIHDIHVSDQALVVTAIQFEHTQAVGHCLPLKPDDSGFQTG